MESLPSRFNPVELARARQNCQVSLPVPHFTRFSELLASPGGDVTATVKFDTEGRQAIATGSLQTNVQVICQRCLQATDFTIDTEFSFGFVASEADADDLDAGYDPVVTDEKGELTAVDLLEDELILQIPQRVVHSNETQCDPAVIEALSREDDVQPNKHNPFSGLDELLKN